MWQPLGLPRARQAGDLPVFLGSETPWGIRCRFADRSSDNIDVSDLFSGSVNTVWMGGHVLSAVAPLEDAKIGLVDITVNVKIAAVAAGIQRDRRPAGARLEEIEVRPVKPYWAILDSNQ